MSLQPFAAGTVTATGQDGKVTHYSLRKIGRGRYRLTLSDRGSDFGEGFEVGLFPLPGAPGHVLVLQLAVLDYHRGDGNLRDYGLLVITGKNSASEIDPDCDKDARLARVAITYKNRIPGNACTVPDRASLERSLLALRQSGRKPNTSLKLDGVTGSPR
ncbi:MAG TPA: hypothetical protein VGG66_11245 [Rhizomicrobium sp.]|jgi:hypothetical protein